MAASMFRIKKTTKPGECCAMRCTNASTDLLCPKHEQIWRDAGSPPLTGENQTSPARTAPALMDPVMRDRLETERQRTIDAIKLAETMPVHTAAHRDRLSSFVIKAQSRVVELEDERKSVVGPLNQAVKTINSWFKPAVDSLEAFVEAGKARIQQALAAERAEQEKALAEIEAGAGEASAEAYALAHRATAAPAGMAERVTKRVQLVNTSLIPDEYWVIDVRLIEKAFREGRDVPGAVWEDVVSLVKERGA